MKDYPKFDETLRRSRSRHLRWLMGVVFFVLVGRLFSLQVIRAEHYRKLAEDNRAELVRVRAPRGLIQDRRGELLAGNRPAFMVTLTPAAARRHPETVERVASMVALPDSLLWSRLRRSGAANYDAIPLKRNLTPELVSQLEERNFELPEAKIEVEPVRYYPMGIVGAHLIGYLGEVREEELGTGPTEDRYKPGDRIGRVGVERNCEEFLRGSEGGRYVEVNAQGKELRDLTEKPPKIVRPGDRVILALDLDLQVRAQDLLEETGTGVVIALDPRNGDILAMASSPSFDPNLFARGISASEWRVLNEDPDRPLLNRAIAGLYPPGSVFKVAVASMALETGAVSPEDTFTPCWGSYRWGNRDFRCWKEGGHGTLSLLPAIAQSCDVYFYHLGELITLPVMSRLADEWGFNDRTGVDLPGEKSGFFPDSHWYDERYGVRGWTRAVELNLSIGQGEVVVTPLDLTTFMAALVNGGRRLVPRVWLRVEEEGGTVRERNPVRSSPLDISPETCDIVRRGMEMAVESGTARAAGLPGIRVAGKTGTAQNPHGEDHAWFVGYAPADEPRIVVLALVEGGGHGGETAAPLVRSLLSVYFPIPDEGGV